MSFLFSDIRTPPQTPSSIFGFDLPNTNPCLSSVIINFNISFPVSFVLVSVTHPHHMTSENNVKPMKTDIALTNVQHLQENSKSDSIKRGTILEGNAPIMKTGNRYRETESFYFYLIHVNLLSHWSERNVELVKLLTGHIIIRYKTKMNSLPFLHSSG